MLYLEFGRHVFPLLLCFHSCNRVNVCVCNLYGCTRVRVLRYVRFACFLPNTYYVHYSLFSHFIFAQLRVFILLWKRDTEKKKTKNWEYSEKKNEMKFINKPFQSVQTGF